MRHFTFEPVGVTRNYSEVALAAMHSLRPTEIGEAEYDYALGVMPPIYVRGGFMVCEAQCDSALGPVHSMYAKIGDKYYAKYAVRGRTETYILPSFLADAYPFDPEDAKRYEDIY